MSRGIDKEGVRGKSNIRSVADMLNTVTIFGRLVKEVEVKNFGSKAVVQGTIACQKDQDNCNFIPFKAWDKVAGVIEKYVNKGDRFIINGSLEVYNYTSQSGQKTSFTYVNVKTVELVESKKASETPQDNENDVDVPF
jgi:single-strand binding protein